MEEVFYKLKVMPKRLKILIVLFLSVIPPVLYISLSNKVAPILPALVASLILYIGMLWVLDSPVRRSGYLTFMLFPSVFAFPVLFLIDSIIKSLEIFNLFIFVFAAIIAIYIVCIYAISLSVNILNIATMSKIPLMQAANTIIYFFTFLTGYIYFSIIISANLPLYISSAAILVISFLLLFQSLSGVIEEEKYKVLLPLVGAFGVLELYGVLLSWKVSGSILALVFTVVIYVYQGIIFHEQRNSFTKGTFIEYMIVFLALVIILVFAAGWGVAGGLV